MNSIVVIVPYYNHPATIRKVVCNVLAQGVPCLLVDDGSSEEAARTASETAAEFEQVSLLRLPVNEGKGAALRAGLIKLEEDGFTHAIQIDADGQHDSADIPAFIAAAEAEPKALILGDPIYGEDVPRQRLFFRQLSRFWVWVETLSFAISDPLVGYRCYPLRTTVALLREVQLGMRMDFDPEIAVRLHWRGVKVRSVPTRVTYPRDGVSHFDLLKDNVRIFCMHTRLFFGMLWRLPGWLIGRRCR